jgi:hypothetical protein
MIEAGSRVLAAIMLATSEQKRPARKSRIGVIRRPSRNMSRAVTSKEPGTEPPRSDQWPFDCEKPISVSSSKIGRTRRTSLKWVPPA